MKAQSKSRTPQPSAYSALATTFGVLYTPILLLAMFGAFIGGLIYTFDMFDMMDDEARHGMNFLAVFLIGVPLWLSYSVHAFSWLYSKLKLWNWMFFLYYFLFAGASGSAIMGTWADHLPFGKWLAILLSLLAFAVIGFFCFALGTESRRVSGHSLGVIALLSFGLFFLVNADGLDEDEAAKVVGSLVTADVTSGEQLLERSQKAVPQPVDYRGPALEKDKTRLLVWDYNFDDSDEVRVYVNGQMLVDSMAIGEVPAVIDVPVPSTVVIEGVRDDYDGSIDYAVKFPETEYTAFNVTYPGVTNTYVMEAK